MYQRISQYLWYGLGAAVIGLPLLFLSVAGNWFGLHGSMPNLKLIENPKSELASELYAADGVLLGKYFRENRSPVEYHELSIDLIQALRATEDARFEEHSGIDFIGTFAIPFYLIMGEKRGSSTLTQQLAKNLFRTRTGEYDGFLSRVPLARTVNAKLKEWILAVRLERSYTKDEILTMYLNTVDFGSNAYGIKVAAKTFFGTTPRKLNAPQAALLVGVLKAPTYYSPILNPERSLNRRNTVLSQMEKYGYLTKEQRQKFSQEGLGVDEYEVENHNTGLATYFRSYVAPILLAWAKENGYDLYADGLKIYTTIDSRMQRYAEEAMATHMRDKQRQFFAHWKGRNPWIDKQGRELKGYLEAAMKQTDHYRYLRELHGNDSVKIWTELRTPRAMKVFTWEKKGLETDTTLSPVDSLRYYKHFLHIGMMSMEPQTGHIKAWVGGINHRHFKYDHVRQGGRQPGSSFKPLVYSVAIENKAFDPCYRVVDAPITFMDGKGEAWTPKNSDNNYSGRTYTLRQALAKSVNTVSAYLVKELSQGEPDGLRGARLIAGYAKNKFGINSPIDPVPAMCLGTSDVTVYEMVGAYSTFVNQGIWTEPIYITRIEDKSGKVLAQFTPKTVESLSEETAYLMTYMLRGATEEKDGTAQGLWRYEFRKNNEVGGKTGTTSNHSDAWFMGLTKDLVTGVWVGGEERSIHFRSIDLGQGARLAMPAFAIFTEKVYQDRSIGYTKGPFPKPARQLRVELDCSKYELNYDDDTSADPSDDEDDGLIR